MAEQTRPVSDGHPSRSINRRQALLGLGSAGVAALLAACGKDGKSDTAGSTSSTSTGAGSASGAVAGGDVAALLDVAGSCTVVPELTEGPYYIDADAVRSDIREDRPGTPLRLAIRVRNFPDCTPRANAVVDIWHCDAGGNYSGFESSSAGGGGRNTPTDTKRYLRGSQVTGADGIAQFVTIYPGWYQGRTVHAHVKVHIDTNQVVTSQLFFDETVTKEVYDAGPYSDHGGQDTTNANDGIFAKANVLTPQQSGDGYLAAINLDVKSI